MDRWQGWQASNLRMSESKSDSIIDQHANQVGEWEEESSGCPSDYSDDTFDYSQDDLDRMYRDAYDGNPDAQWNND